MSQTTLAASSQSQAQTQPKPSDTRPPQPFAKYDDRIAEATDRVLPKQPYLITIPSDFPYRRHTTDPARWYLNTPFHRKEEQLQYMSLLVHQDGDEVLMKVDGTRIDNDNGRLLSQAPTPASEVPTRAQTPVDGAPKKKISLKDYKTKDKSAVNTPERKPVEDIRKQAIKSHKEEVDAKRQEQEPKISAQVKTTEQKPMKPESGTTTPKPVPKTSVEATTRQDGDSRRPVKKRRLSEDGDKKETESNGTKAKVVREEKTALPELLSPEMPTIAKKTQKSRDLPVLLSPKLPQALEKAAAGHAPQRSDEVRSMLKVLGSPRSDKKVDSVTRDPSPGRNRSESQLSAKSATPATKVASPMAKASPAPAAKASTALSNGQTASPRPRQRHFIVLRYGKKNRKRVEALLKFGQRQKKEAIQSVDKDRQLVAKQPTKLDPPKPDYKRPAEPLPEPAAKRPKLAEPLSKADRLTTPRPDGGKSPSHLTKPKSTYSTPKKEPLRSTAMQRVASTDTNEARTPSQEAGPISTPLNISQTSHPKTSPAPTSTPAKSEEHTAWTDLQSRIFQLGRTLKKEGSNLASEGKGKNRQQGVVLLIEALLCFMLNSAAQAQARPNIDPGWSTIAPYYNMVLKQSRPYKHLHGLVVQLGAVWRQSYHQENIRRLQRETLPDDHAGSAPTPGSDGNTRTGDDTVKKQESFLKLRDELVANTKELKTAWLDGSKLLPYELVEEQYPGTWSRRNKEFSKRNPDRRLDPKHLARDLGYFLPLDTCTTVFEASAFALEFLKEWAMIEGVGWKTRVEL